MKQATVTCNNNGMLQLPQNAAVFAGCKPLQCIQPQNDWISNANLILQHQPAVWLFRSLIAYRCKQVVVIGYFDVTSSFTTGFLVCTITSIFGVKM